MAPVSYPEAPAAVSTGDCRIIADLSSMVLDISRRLPHFSERAVRAGIIVAAGAIRTVGDGFYEVQGSKGQVYTVDAIGLVCGCEDYANGAPEHNGSKFCKHLLAACILRRLAERAVDYHEGRRSRVSPLPLVGPLQV